MTNIRIAYVINSVEGGGASQPVPAIAAVLRNAGADVRVFALTPRDRRGLPPMVAAGLDPLVREGGTKDHLAAACWMSQQIQTWGATHIWTSLSRATILGLILGKRLGLPVICWQHAAYLKPWNLRLLRLLQGRADLWIGDSASVTQLTADRLGVGPDRLRCWPIFAVDPATPQAAPWQSGETLRLGSLGRLHPVKGYDILIQALAKLKRDGFQPPVKFTVEIGGEGDERPRLEAMAADAGLEHLCLSGFTDQPQTLLNRSHLYLQPSRSEGFCIGVHEAMAAGLPIIASSVGEILHSLSVPAMGRIVPPNDAGALATALAEMLRNPDDLQAAGQAARHFAFHHFSAERFRETGASIFEMLRPKSA